MEGEFRGDFSRDSFDPLKHFSRVLMQQGRVQLDADWNEQTSIVLHYLQALASDIIGPFGGNGFEIKLSKPNDSLTLTIGSGHYYVDGILCENEKQFGDGSNEVLLNYYNQPNYPIDKDQNPLPKDGSFLVYLDVWEQHISYIEDDSIREVALEGSDTATRAKILWQVRIGDQLMGFTTKDDLYKNWATLTQQWQPANRGMLKARGKQKAATDTEPCLISPDMRYQGPENQLYRVEIHKGGTAGSSQDRATFKWSRDNSAIALPIQSHEGKVLTVSAIGRDPMSGISDKQWIEIIDDRSELLGEPGQLVQVAKVEGQTLTLQEDVVFKDPKVKVKVRRWDYQGKDPKNGDLPLGSDNALLIQGDGDAHWLSLEDGIQIQFQPGATYRTGDYWLIPARTVSGNIQWPLDLGNSTESERNKPMALPPHGVEHHYAPLAILPTLEDCRKIITPIAK